ncbi:MAG TPA: 30S ribosomal protein THX [Catalimonadaceae bacterium]|jgi:ribosomal small subunit protein bTHX|nr:30S ribosomal protein THX [Catalimonadaceae bacterium]
MEFEICQKWQFWEEPKNNAFSPLKNQDCKFLFLPFPFKKTIKMGKGDIKTKKGKLANGSFGTRRRRNETMDKVAIVAKPTVESPKPAAKAKAKKAEK